MCDLCVCARVCACVDLYMDSCTYWRGVNMPRRVGFGAQYTDTLCPSPGAPHNAPSTPTTYFSRPPPPPPLRPTGLFSVKYSEFGKSGGRWGRKSTGRENPRWEPGCDLRRSAAGIRDSRGGPLPFLLCPNLPLSLCPSRHAGRSGIPPNS